MCGFSKILEETAVEFHILSKSLILMSELEEVRHLLTLATYPGLQQHLRNYEQQLLLQSAGQQTTANNETMEVCESTSNQTRSPPSTDNTPSPSSMSKTSSSTPPPPPVFGGRDQIYTPIIDFAWEQGGYNSETVTVYVEIPDVGSVKDQVHCSFTATSFDLIVSNLNGKNYRLIKDNLDKDIVPEKSKFIVKKNKVILKLQKVKGEYSYEHWTNLTAKKPRERTAEKKDPSASIMDMMRDM